MFGASRAYVRQLGRSELYEDLAPVIAVGLIDDVFDKDTDQWYHHYQMINKGNTSKTVDEIQLLLIELPKFKAESIIEKKMQVLWLRFLSELNEDTTEVPKELLAVPEIEKAIELSEEAAYTPAELEAYDKYWDGVRVQRSYVHDAEKKGIEKGILTVARNLLTAGVPLETIVEATKLPLETIKQLAAKQNTN